MDRIGRNTLCPCQSGQKYKRCCGSQAPLVRFLIQTRDLKGYAVDVDQRALVFTDKEVALKLVGEFWPDGMCVGSYTLAGWDRTVRETGLQYVLVPDRETGRALLKARIRQLEEMNAANALRDVPAVPAGGSDEAGSDAQSAVLPCERPYGADVESSAGGQSLPAVDP